MKPYYAIDHECIELPEGLMPWAPTYSPDGKYILFHDYKGGKEWMLGPQELRCITGDMDGRPDFLGGFYYILDEQRMFLSNELGDVACILECEPSLYDWESYRFLPIDLSGDKELGRLCLGRRTYHMAPDGCHLAYNILCPVGLVMVICTLERREDCYLATDFYCVNPPGPTNRNDPDLTHWANGGTLAEIKAFCDGGRGILFVTEGDGGNIDQYKLNLETGEVTRLTDHPDWDEDGALSPDGQHGICASWRGMEQLDILNTVPGSLPLLNFYVGAAIAVYYVSSFPGFANDLQPWLDDQPLSPYHGGSWITANNIAGHPMWSPDSTKILLQERCLTPPASTENERILEKGMAPNRLHIAKIRKAPTKPMPIVVTKIGPWACRLGQYRANGDYPGEHILHGKVSGTIKLTINGNLLGCNHSVTYENYSNDGLHFLSGTERVSGNANDLTWHQHFTVTDFAKTELGKTDINLHFVKKMPQPPRNIPPMTMTGRAESTWQGVTRRGLPGFGPKPYSLPRAADLHLRTEVQEDVLTVYVTAQILGKLRPVCGAEVTFGKKKKITDENGVVTFPAASGTITVNAGMNFISAIMDVY